MDETAAVPVAARLRHLVLAVGIGALLALGVVAGVVPGSGATASAASGGLVAQQVEGSGPAPVGRPLPPTPQRVADTLIMIFLLVVLAAALAACFLVPRWNRARRDRALPADH